MNKKVFVEIRSARARLTNFTGWPRPSRDSRRLDFTILLSDNDGPEAMSTVIIVRTVNAPRLLFHPGRETRGERSMGPT